jgi:hypothetical protein
VIALTGRPPTAIGWYLNAVIVAELVLMTFGIRYLAVICLTICLDLYTGHFVLVPYYTGVIAHTASAALQAGLSSGPAPGPVKESSGNASPRVLQPTANYHPATICGLWALYLCGTFTLAGLAVKLARGQVPEN